MISGWEWLNKAAKGQTNYFLSPKSQRSNQSQWSSAGSSILMMLLITNSAAWFWASLESSSCICTINSTSFGRKGEMCSESHIYHLNYLLKQAAVTEVQIPTFPSLHSSFLLWNSELFVCMFGTRWPSPPNRLDSCWCEDLCRLEAFLWQGWIHNR